MSPRTRADYPLRGMSNLLFFLFLSRRPVLYRRFCRDVRDKKETVCTSCAYLGISSKWNDDTRGMTCLSVHVLKDSSIAEGKSRESAKKDNHHYPKDITLFITVVTAKISLALNSFKIFYIIKLKILRVYAKLNSCYYI